MEDGHCVATVHAEANAIIQAAKNGVSIAGAEIYTTASPCWPCFKLIANAGLSRVYYGEFYRDERSLAVAEEPGSSSIGSRRGLEPTVADSGGRKDLHPDGSEVGALAAFSGVHVRGGACLERFTPAPLRARGSAGTLRGCAARPRRAGRSGSRGRGRARGPTRTTMASATTVRSPLLDRDVEGHLDARADRADATGVRTKKPPRDRSRIVPACCTPSRQNVTDHSTAERASSRGRSWRNRRRSAEEGLGVERQGERGVGAGAAAGVLGARRADDRRSACARTRGRP